MATVHQNLSSLSPRACPRCMLTCFSAGDREPSTNQLLFMQNKPNFRKSQMNVSIFSKMDYENLSDWTLGQNKPNSKPIKPNFKKAQMNVNLTLTKDYRKNDDFVVRKNKPKTNPISESPKMSASVFVTKYYENKAAFRPKKTNPIQTQFPSRNAKINFCCALA